MTIVPAHAQSVNSANAVVQQEDVAPLEPGEAVVTRFPHTTDGMDAQGNPVTLINTDGISVSIVDARHPAEAPMGQHLIDEAQRMFVTAAEVGQVFGVAIAQRPDAAAPTIFVSATAAYGLHRLDGDWMPGMWGVDGGPGTIYRLSPENGYKPEKFADVMLNGRPNSGAALGNITYDKVHDRIFVSDLETGMIHSIDAETGDDLGTFDHGNDGRVAFLDAWSQQPQTLNAVAFDPNSEAELDKCGTGDPSCWNLADFRRRVWGVKIRSDEAGSVRLYYSVWGSDAFGNPDWAKAGDDRRNSVWSVGITKDGLFDIDSVRREFFMPAFWPGDQRFGDRAGNSNPVADITFPECSIQNVMLVAERGSMRNLGLDTVEAFAQPYESRVIRYEIGQDNLWRPKGRYDVGFHDRSANAGEPLLFSSAAGGVDFGYKLDANGLADLTSPSQSVWMTGDGLCSPLGPCSDSTKGVSADDSEVHGLQISPADALVSMEGGVQTANSSQSGLFRSYMVDTDLNLDVDGNPIPEELTRNDATRIGDVAVYQACQVADPLPEFEVPNEGTIIEAGDPPLFLDPPEDRPVHSLNQSHNKWASSSHRVRSSWHYRNGSWHDSRRSWHWRDGSWHQRDKSWHRRNGSWHDRERSWHYKSRSFHSKRQSWDGHFKGRSVRVEEVHDKERSVHVKGRSVRVEQVHDKERSVHVKGRTWQNDDTPTHSRQRSMADKRSAHSRQRSSADDKPVHSRQRSAADDKPQHLRARSRQDNADTHSRSESRVKQQEETKPSHLRSRSRAVETEKKQKRDPDRANQKREEQPQHSRRRSNAAQTDGQPKEKQHSRRDSRAAERQSKDGEQQQQRHRRRLSAQQQQEE